MAVSGDVKPPIGPPDVVWVKASSTSLPESAVICGNSSGIPVYAGRTYHEQELLIGSIITQGSCVYSKDGSVHKTSDYEIMTVAASDPLTWGKVSAEEPLPDDLVKAGRLKNDEFLYVGRIVTDNSTLIGWVSDKRLHVFEDEKEKFSHLKLDMTELQTKSWALTELFYKNELMTSLELGPSLYTYTKH